MVGKELGEALLLVHMRISNQRLERGALMDTEKGMEPFERQLSLEHGPFP